MAREYADAPLGELESNRPIAISRLRDGLFSAPYCGCLEGTMLEEGIHLFDYEHPRDNWIFDLSVENCFPCAVTGK